MVMLKLHYTVAILCATLLFLSERALGALLRRQASQLQRSLQIETLDGSVPDPVVVDYLDQFQVLKNGLDNAERGTQRWMDLVDETAIVSDALTKLLQGYAILVSVQPSSTTALQTASLTVAGQEATNTPAPTGTGTPAPEPTTTSAEAPVSTPEGPVIVTVVAQPNTSIVVVASEGITRTITRGTQTRTRTGAPAATATGTAGDTAEEPLPRSPTTSSKGATQTAMGSSSNDETRPSSDARPVTVLHSAWWVIPAGLVGLLANIV